MVHYILKTELERFSHELLKKAGLDDFSREAVTTGLVESSLRGVDSHGIRLLVHYAKSAQSGRKNPTPDFKIKRHFPTVALLDADHAFGHAAGMKAMDLAMEMAREFGMGAVAVANSTHPGAMASFALKGARQGFLSFAFTHADALTLTHDGKKPFFGTNPVCFAAPKKSGEPFCLDMATSHAPWNRVLMARAQNQELEAGVAADQNGEETTDPHKAACVFPSGGYKGVGLAAMVEILCSVMTGMAFGPHIPAMYKAPMDQKRKLGQFYMCLRADSCVTQEEFQNTLSQMHVEFHQMPAKEGKEIFLPGEKEERQAQKRLKEGVPLAENVWQDLNQLARDFNVSELKERSSHGA